MRHIWESVPRLMVLVVTWCYHKSKCAVRKAYGNECECRKVSSMHLQNRCIKFRAGMEREKDFRARRAADKTEYAWKDGGTHSPVTEDLCSA